MAFLIDGEFAPERRPQIRAEILAESAWAEADRVLAHAWRDMHGLDGALSRASEASNRISARGVGRKLKHAAAHALAVRQSIHCAARLRGLGLFGENCTEPFDPARHEPVGRPPRAAQSVKVVIPGVQRRVGNDWIVLARAVVKAIGS